MALNLNRTKIARTILMIGGICGALGAINFFEPATLALNSIQGTINAKPVSGDIIVVGIDSPSIREIGRWPWPRSVQGDLLSKIDSHKPKAVYLDIGYQGKTTPNDDRHLRQAIKNLQSPSYVIALASDGEDGSIRSIFSHKDAVGNAKSVSAYFPYLFGYVWSLPTTVKTDRGNLKSVASSIVSLSGRDGQSFRIDFGFDPKTIPTFAAKDILTDKVPSSQLRGKTVIIGVTDITQNDVHSMPGWGERPGVMFHVLGAETLKVGFPTNLGWLPLFLFAAFIAAAHLTRNGLKHSKKIGWASSAAIIATSTYLTMQHLSNDPLPALALIISVSIYVARQKAALIRSQRNAVTGFADMTGYMVSEVVSNTLFIAATLQRAETRRGYVLEGDNLKIMREAGRRLSTVIDDKALTHNENQQFLWEMPVIDTSSLGEHLEGLRRLFTQPLVLEGRTIDIDISFGIDRDFTRNVKERMESALDASTEAQKNNASFKIATWDSLEDHISRHFASEFDGAIAANNIELMLEPQIDIADGTIAGAEVSLVWKHPAFGEIRGSKLYELAAKASCSEKVSITLCELTRKANDIWSSQLGMISITIPVPTEVITGESFGRWMTESITCPHFRPSRMILKVIDAGPNAERMELRAALRTASEHGYKIGLGDFGNTNSDVGLISKLKPDAIFLSKAFTSELLGRTGYQIYVESALRIARAENILTIAEAMDDRQVFAELKKQGCDRAQGKIIGNTLTISDFKKWMDSEKVRKVG